MDIYTMSGPLAEIGSSAKLFAASDLAELRRHYNATIIEVRELHADLRILRVVPDAGLPPFLPGQYITLGLGNWEPRVAGVDEENLDQTHERRLARRAYSISCSILDEKGRLNRASQFPYLEFYVNLVRHSDRRPPALTPRLFALNRGDRLFVEQHASGHYTLQSVPANDDIFFFATGTGEAPHNAMIAELLAAGHQGRIVSAVSVRHWRDAAYLSVHEELMRRFSNYWYHVLTTRERENIDPEFRGYRGKKYLQDLVKSGSLERDTGVALDPLHAQAFLCGSPEMIGISRRTSVNPSSSTSGSMLDLLSERGFQPDQPQRPGTLHFERYW
jgi:ferredoxin--NADP+ reductase